MQNAVRMRGFWFYKAALCRLNHIIIYCVGHIPCHVIARSTCDEAIQTFLVASGLLRFARNDVEGSGVGGRLKHRLVVGGDHREQNEKHPSDYCQFASAASRKSGARARRLIDREMARQRIRKAWRS
jgi:hypothetical protein